MSWSVSASGKDKAQVRDEAAARFDQAALNYKGTEEEKDIVQAKERALSMLDELDLTIDVGPGDPPWAANVYCYGSRSTYSSKVVSASIHVSVDRIKAA